MKRNTANGKGYVGQVGGVGMAGKDSSGDNKPNKLPLTNVSLGSGGDHDDDDGVFLPEHDISKKNYKKHTIAEKYSSGKGGGVTWQSK